MVLDDRWMKVCEIAETIDISKERVGCILHGKLDMKKLCARWMPRLLTADQKRTRMKISEQCLERFNKNKTDFVRRRFIAMDETWIHHYEYTPESKQQSKQWTEASCLAPKRQGRFHQQERSWHRCFGMLKAFCLLIILKMVKQ
jgi:histone-lysine N-methyltransferase SETMAR